MAATTSGGFCQPRLPLPPRACAIHADNTDAGGTNQKCQGTQGYTEHRPLTRILMRENFPTTDSVCLQSATRSACAGAIVVVTSPSRKCVAFFESSSQVRRQKHMPIYCGLYGRDLRRGRRSRRLRFCRSGLLDVSGLVVGLGRITRSHVRLATIG